MLSLLFVFFASSGRFARPLLLLGPSPPLGARVEGEDGVAGAACAVQRCWGRVSHGWDEGSPAQPCAVGAGDGTLTPREPPQRQPGRASSSPAAPCAAKQASGKSLGRKEASLLAKTQRNGQGPVNVLFLSFLKFAEQQTPSGSLPATGKAENTRALQWLQRGEQSVTVLMTITVSQLGMDQNAED